MVAELFALVYIADMHLDDGCLDGADAVVQSHTGVGIGAGIEHDAVTVEAHFLHTVYEIALDIALIVVYLYLGIEGTQMDKIVVKGVVAVDAWLSDTEQIEVGAIDNLYFHRRSVLGDDAFFRKITLKSAE